ncbi:hypothetical protein CF327_g7520 [Tilletia walkeri]|nr:hypothetical protein CF327_g7520 [Tilletia walkeri]
MSLVYSYTQIQRDDEEQQLLDAYVKNAAESKPISTRKLNQQRLRAAALVDAGHGNSAASAARPPSLAALALDVAARNFTKLLRITQAEDGDMDGGKGSEKVVARGPAGSTAPTSAPAKPGPAEGKRKSSRVAALSTGGIGADSGRKPRSSLLVGLDGRPSQELSQRTHDRLRLLPAQHLASLQLLLQRYHRRSLTKLTLLRYFFPPTTTRLHLSPAIPLITEHPDSGPIQLVSAATSHAQHLTHASLIALNRLDAKYFSRMILQASRLEYLDLSACLNVNASVIQALTRGCREEGKRSRLRYINLDATGVGAHGVAAAIASFQNLEVLKAANVQGLDDGVFYQAILNAISLEADISKTDSNLASASHPLGSLRSLKLRRTAVGNDSLSLLLGMCDPSLLQTLDIGFTRCSLEGLLEAIQAPAIPAISGASEVSVEALEADALANRQSQRRHISPEMGSELGSSITIPQTQLTPLTMGTLAPSSSQQDVRTTIPSLNAGASGSQQPLTLPEYRSKFSLRKLSLSGLYLHSSRGTTETRLQPLKDLLRTQTALRSLYLQRVPHWGREYDHVQELVGVLREGLRDMLETRAGPDGLPDAKTLHQANAFSAAPLFKKLVLSDNPALGFRVIDGGRTIRGWVFISDLVEEEEIQAGELAKLMHSVGVFCEEIRLSNVNLLASHLAFSPFQRVLELDHTAIEDAMILSALERANMYQSEIVELQSLPATAGSATAKQGGRTRSGRSATSGVLPSKRMDKGKGKALEESATKDALVFGNLRRISLTDAKVSDESLKPLLEANPYLQEIDLTSCRSVPVVQRRNYFEHVLGDDDEVGDDEDRENTQPDTERSGVRQRTSRLNPDRSTSDRRVAIARRQAASGATLTRQEMGDDDFVMGSDSEYDEYRSSRARKRSTSSSPRKRSGSTSPSKRSAASSSQRSREEVIQAVRSAKTARLAATARLHASAYFPTTSTSASSSSRSLPPGSRPSARSSKKRTVNVIRGDPSDEESDTTVLTSGTDDDTDSEQDDDRPLSQRRHKRRRRDTDATSHRGRPKRSAALNLSLVDEFHIDDDEDQDPDYSFSTSRDERNKRSPNKASRREASAGGSSARLPSRTTNVASPFASTSVTVSSGSAGAALQAGSGSSGRRSASPTRSPSSRVRDLTARANEVAREARARARELAAEEEQAARAARAAKRAK